MQKTVDDIKYEYKLACDNSQRKPMRMLFKFILVLIISGQKTPAAN